MGGDGDGCMAMYTADKLRRSICGRERREDATDRWSGGPPTVIYLAGKNQRAAAAAASVDLSTGEKVKILYAADAAATVGPAPESLIRPAEDKCCG